MVRGSASERSPSVVGAAAVVVLATAAVAVAVQTVLETAGAADKFVSEPTWRGIAGALGGTFEYGPVGPEVQVPLTPIVAVLLLASGAAWLVGGWAIARRGGVTWGEALADWGRLGWLWGFVPGAWEAGRLAAFLAGSAGVQFSVVTAANFVFAFTLAGWVATFFTLFGRREASPGASGERRAKFGLWVGMAAYVAVFGTMAVLLWRGLLVPHGDSAMFEEHLWNLTHGKGFRSYIDGHVFLGEHFQIAHLLLLPAYLLWPSHLLLELCQSAALAGGAWPVFRMARRHTGAAGPALALAAAYLLYLPMQMLDLDIVGKTFRVESFGVLFLLFALDALDGGRFARAACLLVLTLTAREDFAIVFAPLGVWIAAHGWWDGGARRESGSAGEVARSERRPPAPLTPGPSPQGEGGTGRGRRITFGLSLTALSVGYVLFVVKVGIPHFRGAEPHFVSYFGRLGGSLDEVLRNLAADPVRVVWEVPAVPALLYALALLMPAGFLPLLSPGRLAVGLPLFATLVLNELSKGPYHHFHAPLVPVVFWAAAAGLGHVSAVAGWVGRRFGAGTAGDPRRWAARFAWTSAAAFAVFFSFAPTGILFWDPGSAFHWRTRFVPGPRADAFSRVFELVPLDARVAATDEVRARFTHHDRSYDYSRYPRPANDGRPGAPPDSDYIVIDVTRNDLGIGGPEDVPEHRERPDLWEVLPDETGGKFLVLRRRWAGGERDAVRAAREGAEDGEPAGGTVGAKD